MKKLKFLGLICLMVILVIPALVGCSQNASSTSSAGVSTTQSLATTTSANVKPINLVFSFQDPATNDLNVGIYQPWFKIIEDRTGGRVHFESHFNGELVSVTDAYDAVVKGTVDLAVIMPSTMPRFPLDEIVAAPPFDTLPWRPSLIYNTLYQKYPEMQAEFSQVKPLILYLMSPGFLGTTNKPVKTISDNAGLKMITADPYQSSRAQALGQIPVSCPPPAFYTTLEKGIADGGDVVTLPEMITYHWADVIKNITLVPFLQMNGAVVMNKQKWDSLPADIQKIIDDSIPEAIDLADQTEMGAYVKTLAKLPGLGTNIITPSADELAKYVQADTPVRNQFIAGLDAKGLPATQIYNDYMSLAKKYASSQYEIKP